MALKGSHGCSLLGQKLREERRGVERGLQERRRESRHDLTVPLYMDLS